MLQRRWQPQQRSTGRGVCQRPLLGVLGPRHQQTTVAKVSSADANSDSEPTWLDIVLDDEVRNQDNEKARTYRRDVFFFDQWKRHRRVDRYWRTVSTMFTSRIIYSLATPLLWILTSSGAICIYETMHEMGELPPDFPSLTLNMTPFTLTSFALSLLLVFRTNSAYGRFDEARKAWGGILNRTRAISTQAVSFIPEEHAQLRKEIVKWTVAFIRTLQAHMQEDAPLKDKLAPWLSEKEMEMIIKAPHRVVKAVEVLGEIVNRAPLTVDQSLTMQEELRFFYDQLGTCERLLRTPIPLSYTRHTCRFLLIWLTLLPLALWPLCGWSTAFVTLGIGMLLLGIEEIGVQVEEPFGLLPLDVICSRAETDMKMQLDDHKDVTKYVDSLVQQAGAPSRSRVQSFRRAAERNGSHV